MQRRWLVTLIGILGAVLSITIGVVKLTDRAPIASRSTAAPAATAVLSARRVPSLLARWSAIDRLRTEVGELSQRLRGSWCLGVDLSGESLVADQTTDPLMPGSNMKLVTAFAVLNTMKPADTLTTRFASRAKVRDGVLDGDLWIIGGGDPLLQTAEYVATATHTPYPYNDVRKIADQVAALGITAITGSVRGDDGHFDRQRAVESWPQRYQGDRQVGALGALTVNDGRTTSSNGVAGALADDPAAAAASTFTDLLVQRGITVAGAPSSGSAPDGARSLLDVPSLPIGDIVGEMLAFSDNDTAELMLKELGARAGTPTTAGGAEAVQDVLAKADIPADGFVQIDGSGLDRSNRVSCATLLAILDADGTQGPVSSRLAVAGTSGTLEDRMRQSGVQGRIRAKTGTLRDVTALSGWADTTRGEHLAFSLVLNTDGRQVQASDVSIQDQLGAVLATFPDGPSVEALSPTT